MNVFVRPYNEEVAAAILIVLIGMVVIYRVIVKGDK